MPIDDGTPSGFRPPIWVGPEADAETNRLFDEIGSYSDETFEPGRYGDRDNTAPIAVPAGPFEFSTTHALERWPTIVWDVNCYYADLKVGYRATRGELKRAYQRLRGWGSTRLTYILRQLLNPEVRSAYDACKPGEVFFDQYIAKWFHDEVLADSVREEGRLLTLDERIARGQEEMDLTELLDKPFDVVGSMMANDAKGVDKQRIPGVPLSSWKWGYYLHNASVHNIGLLRSWQNALLSAPVSKPPFLSVGLSSFTDKSPIKLLVIGYRTVAFIRENEPPTISHATACLLLPPVPISPFDDDQEV